jgi:glycerol kinase
MERFTSRELNLLEIRPGAFEQDPEAILESILEVYREAQRFAEDRDVRVSGIGFAFQRSGVLAWHHVTGEVLHPMISWRDTRTQEAIEALGENTRREMFAKTGIPPSSNYAGGKIALLQHKFPSSDVCVGTLDSFVLARLLDTDAGEPLPFLTEDTMAHRTMLYSFEARSWAVDLCQGLSVDPLRLATIVPSFSEFGMIDGVPVSVSIGDQQASMLGVLNSTIRSVLTLGTIASLVRCTGEEVKQLPGFISSILCSFSSGGSVYFTEGTVNCCAETVKRIEKVGVGRESISSICDRVERTRSEVLAFCPFGNITTPEWEYGHPNVFPDFDQCGREEVTFALVQNLGNFVLQNIRAFKNEGLLEDEIVVAGGVANIDYLLQYLADGSGLKLFRASSQQEGGARGVAHAIAGGKRALDQQADTASGRCFMPDPDRKEYVLQQYGRWSDLKQRAREGKTESRWIVSESKWEILKDS